MRVCGEEFVDGNKLLVSRSNKKALRVNESSTYYFKIVVEPQRSMACNHEFRYTLVAVLPRWKASLMSRSDTRLARRVLL